MFFGERPLSGNALNLGIIGAVLRNKCIAKLCGVFPAVLVMQTAKNWFCDYT
jgi:hypothetical protein